MPQRPDEPCRASLHSGHMHQPVAVFRSGQRRACEERAFVLTAVGIDNTIDATADGFALVVEQPLLAHAQHHLWQYEQERQQPPPPPQMVPLRGAWWGSLVYGLVLLSVALGQQWLAVDPYAAGALDPARVQGGEWWRALTALTLHWDGSHLLGNLGGGALLGYCAAQVWGSARAWLLIVLAAIVANFIEAFIGYSGYVSAGASTAVFAALGAVAAFAWRARGQRLGSPLWRWAPLVAGVALLGFFGAGSSVPVAGIPQSQLPPLQEDGATNVLSHLLGFGCGALAGAFTASGRGRQLIDVIPQWLAAALSTVPIAVAWIFALVTSP